MTELDTQRATELGTAAQHASRNVPVARSGDTAGEVLAAMRGHRYDSAAVIALVDGDRLASLGTLERLLAAPPETVLDQFMDPNPARRHAVDRPGAGGVARRPARGTHARRRRRGRQVRRLVPPTALLEVVLQEHDEDMVRLGGFLRSASPAQTTSVEAIPRRLGHRLP